MDQRSDHNYDPALVEVIAIALIEIAEERLDKREREAHSESLPDSSNDA